MSMICHYYIDNPSTANAVPLLTGARTLCHFVTSPCTANVVNLRHFSKKRVILNAVKNLFHTETPKIKDLSASLR